MRKHDMTIWILRCLALAAVMSAVSSASASSAVDVAGRLVGSPANEVESPGALYVQPDSGDRDFERRGPRDGRRRPGGRRGASGQDGRGRRSGGEQGAKGEGRGLGEGGRSMPPREMILLAMEVVREKLPGFHRQLKRLRERNPERFQQAIRRIMPVIMEYVKLRERDAELAETIIEEFRIEEELRELGHQFQQARENPEEQERIEEQIFHLVNEQFELRHRRHQARLEEMERRLRQLHERFEQEREKFEQQLARRDEMVAKRVEGVKQGKPPERKGRRGRGRFRGSEDDFRGRRLHGPEDDDRPGPPDRRRRPQRRRPPPGEPEGED